MERMGSFHQWPSCCGSFISAPSFLCLHLVSIQFQSRILSSRLFFASQDDIQVSVILANPALFPFGSNFCRLH